MPPTSIPPPNPPTKPIIDALYRFVAHEDPRIVTDLAGVELADMRPVFENVEGTQRRHDSAVVGRLIRRSDVMRRLRRPERADRNGRRGPRRVGIVLEWQTKWLSTIVRRILHYVITIQEQYPVPVHPVVLTFTRQPEEIIYTVAGPHGEPVGIEVISVPQLEAERWITPAFPRRALLIPALRDANNPAVVVRALEILKPVYIAGSRSAHAALLRALIQLSSNKQVVIMCAQHVGIEIPTMSELAEEIPEMNWLDEQLAIRDRESFANGIEQGKAEGIELGKAEGIELGKAEGIEQGRAEGIEQGKAEGIEQGKAEGIEEGKASVLARAQMILSAEDYERLRASLEERPDSA